MKLPIPALFMLLLAGCLAAPAKETESNRYAVTASIEPAGDDFLATLRVTSVAPDGTHSSLSSPKVLVSAGQEAELETTSPDGSPLLHVNVRMPELSELDEGARIEVRTMRDGAVVETPELRIPMPTAEAASDAPRRISCRFAAVDVHAVIEHIAGTSGVNVLAPPDLQGEVSFVAEDIGGPTALALALGSLGYGVEVEPDVLRIVPMPERDRSACIDVSFENVDLQEALQEISRISGANLVVEPGVTGTVTLEAQSVPWRFVLAAATSAADCTVAYEKGGVYRIASPPSDEQ